MRTEFRGGGGASKENQVQGRLHGQVLKYDESMAKLAQIYGVHPTQITRWKKQLLDSTLSFFEGRDAKGDNVDMDEIYKKIGKLEMERDFFSMDGVQFLTDHVKTKVILICCN